MGIKRINEFPSISGTLSNDDLFLMMDDPASSSGVTKSSSLELLKQNIYNSPAFTGTPLAPTAPSGTNTHQIATTSFVITEVSNLVDAAPELLNTLRELADAIDNDPNFAFTVASGVATVSGIVDNVAGVLSSGLTVVSGLLPSVSGSGFVNSSFDNNVYTISVSGLQPSGNYSVEGHTHIISEVSGLQNALDSKQPSGVYASGVHSHEVSDITDFNSSVSGLLPVKNVLGSGYVVVSSSSGIYTISTSGLQPSGNYSVVGHTHTSSNITDFNSSVSGLLPSVSGSGFVNSSFSNNVYTISVSGLQPSGNYSVVGHTHTASNITDFVSASSGVIEDALSTTVIGQSGVSVVYNSVNDTLVVSASGLNSSYISDFNSSVSGLLPTIANSGDNRILTSTGTSTGVNAESNATFDGTTLAVSGVFVATSGSFTQRLDAPLSYYTVSPAISGTVNDWDPGSVADVVRASGISSARINGLVDTYGADAMLLYNVGTSGDITLTHASGTANNQFLVPWLGDYVLGPNGGAALIVRDKVDNKWRIT